MKTMNAIKVMKAIMKLLSDCLKKLRMIYWVKINLSN